MSPEIGYMVGVILGVAIFTVGVLVRDRMDRRSRPPRGGPAATRAKTSEGTHEQ